MAKYNLNLRDSNSKTETPIHLVVRWSKQRLVFPTKESINPKYWNKDKQKAKETSSFPEYPELNLRLENILKDVKDSFRAYQNDNEGQEPKKEEFREILKVKILNQVNEEKLDLFGFIKKFIEEAETRINEKTGLKLSKGARYSYNQTFEGLKDFSKYSGKKIDFENIDLDFYDSFISYLTDVKEYSVNNIGNYIKNLKIFLNAATERGINKNMTFQNRRFIKPKEEVNNIYLTDNELLEIFDLDLSSSKRLDNARDLFLIGCYTGLRFSDYSQIKANNISQNRITIKVKKTSKSIVIPLHEVVKKILAKYYVDGVQGLPRSISNVNLNLYIKEVCKKVKSLNEIFVKNRTKGGEVKTEYLKKYQLVSSHTARRSFATNLYNSGYPAISIMKVTGHKTESAFMKYIKVTEEENATHLERHWQSAQPLMQVI